MDCLPGEMMADLNWPVFCSTLGKIGPRSLSGLPDVVRQYIQSQGIETDEFWSRELFERASTRWSQSPEDAVSESLEIFCRNVKCAFSEPPLKWCVGWVSDPTSGEPLSMEASAMRIWVDLSAADRRALLAAGSSAENL
jgi:hypothetical protein